MKNLERSDQLAKLVRRLGRRLAPFAALSSQMSLLAAAGCNAADDSGEVAAVSQSLASDKERVLGFEDPLDWAITSGNGVLASNSESSQGSASLAVPGSGYVAIRNVTSLTTGSADVPEIVGYDVFLPEGVDIDCAALSQGAGPVSCGPSCLAYDTSDCVDLDEPPLTFCTEFSPPRPCVSDADCVGLGGPNDTVQDHECEPASSFPHPLTCQCPPFPTPEP